MSFDNNNDAYKAIFDSLIETPPRTTCRLRALCTPCEKVSANNQTVNDIVKLIVEQVKKDSIDYIVVLTCDQQYYFFYHTITGTHAPAELQKQYEFTNYRTQWSCKDFRVLIDQLNPDDILYQAQLQLSQIQKPQPTATSSIQTDAVHEQYNTISSAIASQPGFNAEQQNTTYMQPMFQQLLSGQQIDNTEQQYFAGSQMKEREQRIATVDDEVQTLNTQTNLRFEDFLIAERDKNFAFYHGIKPVSKPYVDIYAVSNTFYANCAQQIFIRKYAPTLAVCDVTDAPHTIVIPHECTVTMSALLISRRGQGLPIKVFQGILPQLKQALINKRLWYQQRVVAVRKVAVLVFIKDKNGDSYLRSICNSLNDVAGYNIFTTKQIDSYKNGFFVNDKHNNNSSFIANDNDCSQLSSQNITITNTRDIF